MIVMYINENTLSQYGNNDSAFSKVDLNMTFLLKECRPLRCRNTWVFFEAISDGSIN